MRLLDKFFFTSFIFVLYSCSDFDGTNNNIFPNYAKTSISPEEAVQFAIDMADKMADNTRGNDRQREVGEVYVWETKDICKFENMTRAASKLEILPDTLLYIVNFKDANGYVLVSADKRLGDVVGIIDKGSLKPSGEIDNPGLNLYLNELCLYYAEQLNNSSRTTTRSSYYTDWEIVERKGPLTWTEWHQHAPYNNNCPIINGSHALAGCVAIAVGQIMAYHHAPTTDGGYTYLWNEMGNPYETPQTTAAEVSVAKLIARIGNIIGMNYGLNSSGASPTSAISAFEEMGYHYELYLNGYSIDACWAEVDNNRPFYIRGGVFPNVGGHAWVIDGYMIEERVNIDDPSDIQYRDYVRCNWGWGGSDNGFYITAPLAAPNYSYDNHIITNIYPINYNVN